MGKKSKKERKNKSPYGSPSRESKQMPDSSSKNFFQKESNTSYYLSQKSEMLLFDKIKEPEENTENFVWRKKNQKIGIDKLDPEKVLIINRLKQEETAVSFFLFFL